MQKSPDLYLKNGLTDQEVLISLQKYGYNEIPEKKSFNILKILLSQFASFLIIILAAIFLAITRDSAGILSSYPAMAG